MGEDSGEFSFETLTLISETFKSYMTDDEKVFRVKVRS